MGAHEGPWLTPEGLTGRSCRFGHAVNSQAGLAAFVQGTDNVAEGDVLMGRLKGRAGALAIMAHPPDRQSDLCFDDWVQAATAHGHALKVDLKEPEVIDGVLQVLAAHGVPEGRLILNADTVQGPGAQAPRLDQACLARCRAALPGALISVGSTLGEDARSYEPAHLEALAQGGRPFAPLVTLCVRADLVMARPEPAQALSAEGFLLTVWNRPGDRPSPGALRALLPDAMLDLRVP